MSRQVRLASNVVRAGLRGVLVVVAAGLLMPFVASAQGGEPTPMVITRAPVERRRWISATVPSGSSG